MQVNQTSRNCRPKVQFQNPKLSAHKAKNIRFVFYHENGTNTPGYVRKVIFSVLGVLLRVP